MKHLTPKQLSTTLLVTAAIVGIGLAGSGLLEARSQLPADAVARVNQTDISLAQFEHFVTVINANSKTLKPRREILERLIEEELLVQRGLEMQLLSLNSTVRNAMVQAVTHRFKTESSAQDVSETELRDFFIQHRAHFSSPARYQASAYRFPTKVAAERAAQQWRGGESPPQKNKMLLPMGLLGEAKLTQYLGPSLSQQLLPLTVMAISDVINIDGQFYVLQKLQEKPATSPDFEILRSQVKNFYQRQAQQTAFTDYLSWLKDQAKIQIQRSEQ